MIASGPPRSAAASRVSATGTGSGVTRACPSIPSGPTMRAWPETPKLGPTATVPAYGCPTNASESGMYSIDAPASSRTR